jgi:dTDP-4-amino-4,6-dideoxygalactose transaminase
MNPRKDVPFVDLVTPHLDLEDELIEAVRGVVRSAGFIGGPVLEQFERDFADYCGAKHAIGVGSGTDALRFALIAAGVGPGDIVVTVPNTFVATIEAIVQAGATPHFVDIDPKSFNMDADALDRYLQTECDLPAGTGLLIHRKSGQPVRAVLPVHLYGQMCDMDRIQAMTRSFGLLLLEDACQSHGSEYFSEERGEWRRAGSISAATAFSFYPGKNLGACGEAGAVTTDDDDIADRVRMIRDHGQREKYHHALEGYNGRLDAMQAAILAVKLPHLQSWNEKRRAAAEVYNELLKGIDGLSTPVEVGWSRGVYHLYVVRTEDRDQLQRHLGENGIASGLHYPVPLHLLEGYSHLGYQAGDFPVAERVVGEILFLPMYPQLRKDQQEAVANALLEWSSARTVEASQ